MSLLGEEVEIPRNALSVPYRFVAIRGAAASRGSRSDGGGSGSTSSTSSRCSSTKTGRGGSGGSSAEVVVVVSILVVEQSGRGLIRIWRCVCSSSESLLSSSGSNSCVESCLQALTDIAGQDRA